MRLRVLLMRCGVFFAGIIPVTNSPAQSVSAATRPEHAGVTSWVAGLRDGSGAGLAQAQRGFAKTGRALRHEELAQLVARLHDPRSKVRAAAAAAIGAAGAGAQIAYPELVSALSDSVPAVRAEAAWALSMVARGTKAVVPAAIVDALTDHSTLVSVRALEALKVFTTPVAMLLQIDALLADSIPASRLAGLRLLRGLSARSLTVARIVALLDDSDAALRLEAAWALEAYGPSASSALPFLENRRVDVEADVREAVDDAIRAIRRPESITDVSPQDDVSCAHRPVDRRIPTSLTVLTGSTSLFSDGRGAYSQERGSLSHQNVAFSLRLRYAAAKVRASAADSAGSREPARWIALDLSAPVTSTGARALGVARDSAAQFHVFHMLGANRVIWNLRDMPVGSSGPSDRLEIQIHVDGGLHVVQLGPWALSANARRATPRADGSMERAPARHKSPERPNESI